MSDRNQLPQSGWNLPPGVSENDPYFTDESEPEDEEEGEETTRDACSFCRSTKHSERDCPEADSSIDEDLEW